MYFFFKLNDICASFEQMYLSLIACHLCFTDQPMDPIRIHGFWKYCFYSWVAFFNGFYTWQTFILMSAKRLFESFYSAFCMDCIALFVLVFSQRFKFPAQSGTNRTIGNEIMYQAQNYFVPFFWARFISGQDIDPGFLLGFWSQSS